MASYKIQKVFDILRSHLHGHLDRLDCFNHYEFQAEGWLKAEWLAVLYNLKRLGHINNFDREVIISPKDKRKIDLAIDLNDGRHWIELKHWILKQKSKIWRPIEYIYALEDECEKFEALGASQRAWMAVLYTTNPGTKDWEVAIKKFNKDCAPWCLLSVYKPKYYPKNYFFGIIQVKGING